jgi:hypothetical protein
MSGRLPAADIAWPDSKAAGRVTPAGNARTRDAAADSPPAPNGDSLMPEISLPAEDAAELAGFLRFLDEWLTAGHAQIADSLARFMDDHPYGVETLRHDLSRFRSMLGNGNGNGDMRFLGSNTPSNHPRS